MPTAAAAAPAPEEQPRPSPEHDANDPAGALRVAACRKCLAVMVWVENQATGKRLPIDRSPVIPYRGRVVAWETGMVVFTGPDTVRFLTKENARRAGGPVYRSHFSTCPFAETF